MAALPLDPPPVASQYVNEGGEAAARAYVALRLGGTADEAEEKARAYLRGARYADTSGDYPGGVLEQLFAEVVRHSPLALSEWRQARGRDPARLVHPLDQVPPATLTEARARRDQDALRRLALRGVLRAEKKGAEQLAPTAPQRSAQAELTQTQRAALAAMRYHEDKRLKRLATPARVRGEHLRVAAVQAAALLGLPLERVWDQAKSETLFDASDKWAMAACFRGEVEAAMNVFVTSKIDILPATRSKAKATLLGGALASRVQVQRAVATLPKQLSQSGGADAIRIQLDWMQAQLEQMKS